jgi:hypothetical protein
MKKEDSVVSGTKVKWKGAFDFARLYNKLKDWLGVEGYGAPNETLYVERVKPDGKQIEIVWNASKTEEDYYGYRLDIVFRGTNLNEVEVNQGGKKMKLLKGTIEITFKSKIIYDVNGMYKDRPLWGKVYHKYFMVDNTNKNQIELYDKTLDLVGAAKDFLSLYQF